MNKSYTTGCCWSPAMHSDHIYRIEVSLVSLQEMHFSIVNSKNEGTELIVVVPGMVKYLAVTTIKMYQGPEPFFKYIECQTWNFIAKMLIPSLLNAQDLLVWVYIVLKTKEN